MNICGINCKIQMKKLLDAFDGDILLVTHNQDEAYHICEKAAVVDGGRILASGKPSCFFWTWERPGSPPDRMPEHILGHPKGGGPAKWKSQGGDPAGHSATGERGVRAVGVRAGAFSHTCPENRFPVSFTGHMELPFETQMCFRYEGQAETEGELWWSRTMDGMKKGFLQELGVAP